MSNEDYRQGYKDGWKDGYEQARKDHLPITYPTQPFAPLVGGAPKCAVCGLPWSELTNYVCPRAGCPSKVNCKIPTYNINGPFASPIQTTAIKDPGDWGGM